jgi:aminoglycoside N3'-acetyltransferase
MNALTRQLLALGVQPASVLVVHTAFSKLGPIDGGPRALIDALTEALGPMGTLVMPSMGDDDDHVFEPAHSTCRDMGVVADTFWRLPDVLRSDSLHAFAARGPAAATITAAHPVEIPHGWQSPVGRVYELDGQVLLLGIGQDANTSVHLAENMAGVRYRLATHATVLVDGRLQRIDYGEVDHCCQGFALVDEWLDSAGLQKRGLVGRAEARLARVRDVVDTALAKLRADETVFLHAPARHCDECDRARASISS